MKNLFTRLFLYLIISRSYLVFVICNCFKVSLSDTHGPLPLCSYVVTLLMAGHKREQIEDRLREQGYDERFVLELVAEGVKLHNMKIRAQALTLILTGAFICLLSFVLSITASFTHLNFPIVLYGLTSLGIIIVFAGFVKIF